MATVHFLVASKVAKYKAFKRAVSLGTRFSVDSTYDKLNRQRSVCSTNDFYDTGRKFKYMSNGIAVLSSVVRVIRMLFGVPVCIFTVNEMQYSN